MRCYRSLAGMPEVSPPPVRRKGFITFGSLNRFSKVSERVLECWARILVAVPDSRLALCVPEGAVRQASADLFAGYGAAPKRLTYFSKFHRPTPTRAFWQGNST